MEYEKLRHEGGYTSSDVRQRAERDTDPTGQKVDDGTRLPYDTIARLNAMITYSTCYFNVSLDNKWQRVDMFTVYGNTLYVVLRDMYGTQRTRLFDWRHNAIILFLGSNRVDAISSVNLLLKYAHVRAYTQIQTTFEFSRVEKLNEDWVRFHCIENSEPEAFTILKHYYEAIILRIQEGA